MGGWSSLTTKLWNVKWLFQSVVFCEHGEDGWGREEGGGQAGYLGDMTIKLILQCEGKTDKAGRLNTKNSCSSEWRRWWEVWDVCDVWSACARPRAVWWSGRCQATVARLLHMFLLLLPSYSSYLSPCHLFTANGRNFWGCILNNNVFTSLSTLGGYYKHVWTVYISTK